MNINAYSIVSKESGIFVINEKFFAKFLKYGGRREGGPKIKDFQRFGLIARN
jgi:hypothetical protein